MAIRRRRRPKFTWFPKLGTAGLAEAQPFNQRFATLLVPQNGDESTAITPLIVDFPQDGSELTQNSSLADVLASEYFIERIVGKAWVGARAPADDPPTIINVKTILIGVGLFVARANDPESGGGANTPIGSATPLERFNNYSTLSLDCDREPWMWRRTWLCATNRGDSNPQALPGSAFEADGSGIALSKDNIIGRDVESGPHMDVRSVRRVRTDERLWLAFSARSVDLQFNGQPTVTDAQVRADLCFDYRVLGALRRAKNRSNF